MRSSPLSYYYNNRKRTFVKKLCHLEFLELLHNRDRLYSILENNFNYIIVDTTTRENITNTLVNYSTYQIELLPVI